MVIFVWGKNRYFYFEKRYMELHNYANFCNGVMSYGIIGYRVLSEKVCYVNVL